MLRLKTVDDPREFATLLEEIVDRFAPAKAAVEGRALPEALAAARRQCTALLPQGLRTPGHVLARILRKDRPVGVVWYALTTEEAFLYDIFIESPFRRQGLGRAALAKIEQAAQEAGCRQLWLNVFAANHAALSFYEHCGYFPATLHLAKRLG